MMLRSSANLGFPRRVVTHYLLFCLVATAMLAAGILMTSYTVIESHTTSASLSRLGKIAAAVELEYLRSGTTRLQATLEDSRFSTGLLDCAVVSHEGAVLAHSDANRVGNQVEPRSGEQLRWGSVSGIRYQDAYGHCLNEFRIPLVADEDHFGSLRITVQELNFWSTLLEILQVAPSVLLMPLVLITAGGFYLGRMTGPLAKVDQQLRRLALQRPTQSVQLETIPSKDAISMGWNRIVDQFQQVDSDSSGQGLQDRLAEVVAKREQNELAEVLQNITDGIAVTDPEGRLTFANRAVAALLGADTTDEALAGIELEGRILAAAGEAAVGPLFGEDSAHRPAIAEVQRQSDEEQRTLRIARLPMVGGKRHGHVWSVRDVTQQKLAERSRDQFIDMATHELRTPLSNIKAYAETLATCDSIEVEEQKEFCNVINSEVTRLARFVDDLLSISSMEAGSIVLQRQSTIAAKLFEEVLAKVQPLMQQKEITFDVQLPEKMADLQIDKDKIVAVIVNLLGNAAKYTPVKGSVSLRVQMDASQLQIAVVDSGVGIAAEELPKVFEKFFRSEDPRVQQEVGTGLGLSLAREVIHMHGGEITVESQVDQGTTFMATIPIQ